MSHGELSRGRSAIAELQIRPAADVGGVHIVPQSRERPIVLDRAAEQLDGCRRIVLLHFHCRPDGGNEVMLHEGVLGSFRANLVCELTGFLCSS